jgi:hypothetical protein
MVSSTDRLADVDLLEAPLQRGVLLDVLAVFVEGRRADQPQLAACQQWLEHVAGVHGALAARAGTDDRVQLVDEGDDLALGVGDLLEDGLESLLELAAVLRPRDHRPKVEADELLAAQALGHVAVDDPLGQPFDHGGLADTGLADEDGVVLRPPAEHLDDAPDLGVTADDRVELALAGPRGEVGAVLRQGIEGPLGVLRVDAPAAAQRRNGGLDGAGVQPEATRLGQRQQQVIGRDIGVAHGGHRSPSGFQNGHRRSGEPRCADRRTGDGRHTGQRLLGYAGSGLEAGTGCLKQRGRRRVGLLGQCLEQVGGLGVGVAGSG